LFLLALEKNKSKLLDATKDIEGRIYIDSVSYKKAPFPNAVFEMLFDNFHWEVAVTERNYNRLIEMKKTYIEAKQSR
jgi:hypothetical protein